MQDESALAPPLTTPEGRSRLPRNWHWQHWAFYLGVPLAIGCYAALNNWQLIHTAGAGWAITFYLAHALVPWTASILLTGVAMRLLRPWKPPPVAILLVGHTLACLVVLPYINWLTGAFGDRWAGMPMTIPLDSPLTGDFWIYWFRAGVIWVGVNLLFDHFLGLPRCRYPVPAGYDEAPAVAAAGDASLAGREARPAFLERIPAGVSLADVIAVKAEQHYIKVVTAGKTYMVLHRFGDALHELEGSEGLQVHRSWWVRKNAILRVRQNARKMNLVMESGAEVPVSGPYQAMARQFARNANLPATPLTLD